MAQHYRDQALGWTSIPGRDKWIFASPNNQAGSEAHLATNPIGAGCCSQRDEVTVAWSSASPYALILWGLN